MRDFSEDAEKELRIHIRKLPVYAPRPGFETRFWTRAQPASQPEPGAGWWRWLPAAGALVGVGLGLLLAATQAMGPGTDIRNEAGVRTGLPEGSLADLIIHQQAGD